MKFVFAIVAIILSFGCTSARDVSERCRQLADFTSRLVAKVEEVTPPEYLPSIKGFVDHVLNFDVKNATAREILLCNIAAAKNQRELFDALPTGFYRRYESFQEGYAKTQQDLASKLGGYTNAQRLANLAIEMNDFGHQQKPGKTLGERTDLATLTDFMKMLQVKYGSRAISYLIWEKNGNFLVKDSGELAKKLYEGDYDAITKYTGLQNNQVMMLTNLLMGQALDMMTLGDDPSKLWELVPFAAEGMSLLGDMGLFTLDS